MQLKNTKEFKTRDTLRFNSEAHVSTLDMKAFLLAHLLLEYKRKLVKFMI